MINALADGNFSIMNITISGELCELKISIRQVAEITGLKYIEDSKIQP